MVAYDTAYPSQVASTNITISVNRNPRAPEFVAQNYERTITEDYTLGLSLVQITATDADGVCKIGFHVLIFTYRNFKSATSCNKIMRSFVLLIYYLCG